MIAVVATTLVAFGACQHAQAQVELIVSPTSAAAPAFASALQGPSPAKSSPLDPALFQGVTSVRPVFPPSPESAKSLEESPPYAFTLSVSDSAAYHVLKQRWEARDDIASVEPNVSFALHTVPIPSREAPPDPQADSLNHLDVIRARQAWTQTTGAPSVRIGLVDTGLDLDHPDLSMQLWVNPGEDINGNGRIDPADWNGVDDDQNGWVDDLSGYDFVDRPDVVDPGDFQTRDADPSADPSSPFSGHATAVAGAMSAARGNGEGIAGVSPGSRLVPLRAFGGDGRGATDDIAAAIAYAAQQGIDVVNLSFGRDFASPLLQETIRYAVGQGTVVVASAGNNGGDDPHYPSDYPEVLSVAWLNANGTDIAFRGEYGIGIDVGAPGTAIYTTVKPAPDEAPSVNSLYGRQSGSSMAAPLVSGTAALLRAVDPTLSPASIRSIITASALDLGAPGWDHRTASGRLDVASALARALPARTAVTSPEHDSGIATSEAPIVGTAIDPSFAHYAVYYARGTSDLDEQPDSWTRLAGPIDRQVLDDTLATFPAGSLDEGAYTLRLVTTLRSGTTVEDRRRVYVDRTPPAIHLSIADVGLVGGMYGVVVDVGSDDVTTATLQVRFAGQSHTVHSDVRNRRHGLYWADERGRGGPAAVRIALTNVSGLTRHVDTTLQVPPRRINTALFEETTLDVPHGTLLPQATDFDGDALKEIVFNQYEDGALGDTLRAFEWDGEGFSPAASLVANVIPRDVGDTNSDGRQELLTQVGGATLLLEQSAAGGFPTQERFIDTTGLSNPSADEAVWGARLSDLDRDGQGEILAHNRSVWRVLEWDGSAFAEVAQLENPTEGADADPAVSANGFQQPQALFDDFDGDGRMDVLVGDNDGDWIIYETAGDDRYRVAWTYATNRIDAGARFAAGDFDGDGDTDFVTYTQNLPILTDDGAREPPIGVYYIWETEGDDQYRLADTLPVQGNSSSFGSLAAADFDDDGRDEVAIAHPPDLYILGRNGADEWGVRYHRGVVRDPEAGLRSAAMVTADLTGDGYPELIAATADARFHLWQYRAVAAALPPPQWEVARAQSADAVTLRWQAPQADSVTVYAGFPGSELNPITTTPDSTFIRSVGATARYAVRAWYGGDASPLSTVQTVRPHAPAVVEGVSYPSPRSVALRFSERLAASTTARQFQLDEGGGPTSAILQANGYQVVLRFEDFPTPRSDVLRWQRVVDAEGVPVGQDAAAVTFPAPADEALIVERWTVEGQQRVILDLSAPLDPSRARDPSNYSIVPHGSVERVLFDPAAPHRVSVEVGGVALGAVGADVSLRLTGLQSRDGALLSPEGAVIRLVEPAANLSDVYAYPNPHYQSRHGDAVTIAGLPAEATVRILSAQGSLVRVLTETGRDGGLQWDLQDRNGRRVPSGVYLIRVEAPHHEAVLRKVAIVR